MRKSPIAYFVRHGQVAGNASNSFRGQADSPLNAHGVQDAKNLKDWFSTKAISAVYASPKTRAKDTAEQIATPKQLKVQTVDAFKPIDVGYLSGEPKTDHKNVMDYFEKNPHEKIPMGESINEFRSRTQGPIKDVLAKGAHSPNPVVAVVHSSIIHELNHIITGDHNQTLVKPGGVVGVYQHPTKGLALKAELYPEHEESVPYHG